jgi:U3 small nucleolar RNA-associated protein 22
MNSRLFHKRAFYLAVIANYVSDPSNGLDVGVYYESKKGDPRLTTLILQPRHGTSSFYRIFSLTMLTVLQITHPLIFQS